MKKKGSNNIFGIFSRFRSGRNSRFNSGFNSVSSLQRNDYFYFAMTGKTYIYVFSFNKKGDF